MQLDQAKHGCPLSLTIPAICPESADAILWAAFKRLGIEGASTHSFRRTSITWMHNERVPIKHIQSISGHRSLAALQRYIDVTEQDKERAIATLSFRSPD